MLKSTRRRNLHTDGCASKPCSPWLGCSSTLLASLVSKTVHLIGFCICELVLEGVKKSRRLQHRYFTVWDMSTPCPKVWTHFKSFTNLPRLCHQISGTCSAKWPNTGSWRSVAFRQLLSCFGSSFLLGLCWTQAWHQNIVARSHGPTYFRIHENGLWYEYARLSKASKLGHVWALSFRVLVSSPKWNHQAEFVYYATTLRLSVQLPKGRKKRSCTKQQASLLLDSWEGHQNKANQSQGKYYACNMIYTHVCMNIYIYMYVSMYLCIYVSMYVWMYVCMYVYT